MASAAEEEEIAARWFASAAKEAFARCGGKVGGAGGESPFGADLAARLNRDLERTAVSRESLRSEISGLKGAVAEIRDASSNGRLARKSGALQALLGHHADWQAAAAESKMAAGRSGSSRGGPASAGQQSLQSESSSKCFGGGAAPPPGSGRQLPGFPAKPKFPGPRDAMVPWSVVCGATREIWGNTLGWEEMANDGSALLGSKEAQEGFLDRVERMASSVADGGSSCKEAEEAKLLAQLSLIKPPAPTEEAQQASVARMAVPRLRPSEPEPESGTASPEMESRSVDFARISRLAAPRKRKTKEGEEDGAGQRSNHHAANSTPFGAMPSRAASLPNLREHAGKAEGKQLDPAATATTSASTTTPSTTLTAADITGYSRGWRPPALPRSRANSSAAASRNGATAAAPPPSLTDPSLALGAGVGEISEHEEGVRLLPRIASADYALLGSHNRRRPSMMRGGMEAQEDDVVLEEKTLLPPLPPPEQPQPGFVLPRRKRATAVSVMEQRESAARLSQRAGAAAAGGGSGPGGKKLSLEQMEEKLARMRKERMAQEEELLGLIALNSGDEAAKRLQAIGKRRSATEAATSGAYPAGQHEDGQMSGQRTKPATTASDRPPPLEEGPEVKRQVSEAALPSMKGLSAAQILGECAKLLRG